MPTLIVNYSQVKMMDFIEDEPSLKQDLVTMEESFRYLEAPLLFTFAVEGCTQLTSNCTNIIPNAFTMEFALVCLLPSSQCSNA